jgi:hypothetical protein
MTLVSNAPQLNLVNSWTIVSRVLNGKQKLDFISNRMEQMHLP